MLKCVSFILNLLKSIIQNYNKIWNYQYFAEKYYALIVNLSMILDIQQHIDKILLNFQHVTNVRHLKSFLKSYSENDY